MADQIKVGSGLKQRAKESFRLGTRGLLGVIRNIYCRINNSKPATVFSAGETAKMLEDQTRLEQQKAEAVEFLRRRLTIQ